MKAGRAEDRTAERIVADARTSAEHGVRAVRREAQAWTIAVAGIQLAITLVLGVGAWRVPVSGINHSRLTESLRFDQLSH
ncbi:hypothetical protein ACH5A2_15855 [Streptomyces collinus]|uniref:hypothetical protein n=1 Tax=Streptomyces collinus TaxID=42684 RepID=UPI00379273A5